MRMSFESHAFFNSPQSLPLPIASHQAHFIHQSYLPSTCRHLHLRYLSNSSSGKLLVSKPSFSVGFLPICKCYCCRSHLVVLVDVSPGSHPRLFLSLPSASSLARVFQILELCNFQPSTKKDMVAPGSPRGRARCHCSQLCPQACLPPKVVSCGLRSPGDVCQVIPGLGSLPPFFSFPFPFFSPPLPQNLRHRLRKTKEQAQHQEQLLKEQERELKALQEQLSR